MTPAELVCTRSPELDLGEVRESLQRAQFQVHFPVVGSPAVANGHGVSAPLAPAPKRRHRRRLPFTQFRLPILSAQVSSGRRLRSRRSTRAYSSRRPSRPTGACTSPGRATTHCPRREAWRASQSSVPQRATSIPRQTAGSSGSTSIPRAGTCCPSTVCASSTCSVSCDLHPGEALATIGTMTR